MTSRFGCASISPNAWPTLNEQRELFAQLTAKWLTPYRAQRTHVVTTWSTDSHEIYERWQRCMRERRVQLLREQITPAPIDWQQQREAEQAAKVAYWEAERKTFGL